MQNNNPNPDEKKSGAKGTEKADVTVKDLIENELNPQPEGGDKDKKDDPNPNPNPNPDEKKDEGKKDEGKGTEDTDLKDVKALEIEGVEYTLDKDGNALDKEGKIFKTVDEVKKIVEDLRGEQEEEEATETTLIEDVISKFGVQVLDDKGQPKVYPDTEEGIVEYIKDSANEINKQEKKEFFETFPIVKKLLDHIQQGGTEESFFKRKSESLGTIDLKTATEADKMNLIIKDLVAKGFDDKTALDTATLYKDSNRLEVMAETALKSRKDAEEAAEKKKKEDYQKEVEAEEKAIVAHWNSVNEVVKKGDLSLISIPEAEKPKFFEYISKAVDENGNSQMAIDKAKLPIEKRLLLDYFVYKQLDISNLALNKKKTDQTTGLKARLKGNEQQQQNNTQTSGKKKDNPKNPNDVELTVTEIV